jgi:hypothetical protein
MRLVARVPGIALLGVVPLLVLVVLVGTGALDVLTVPAPAVHDVSVAELGIGELEMGRDFGRPASRHMGEPAGAPTSGDA